jgi:hypothetical protein
MDLNSMAMGSQWLAQKLAQWIAAKTKQVSGRRLFKGQSSHFSDVLMVGGVARRYWKVYLFRKQKCLQIVCA